MVKWLLIFGGVLVIGYLYMQSNASAAAPAGGSWGGQVSGGVPGSTPPKPVTEPGSPPMQGAWRGTPTGNPTTLQTRNIKPTAPLLVQNKKTLAFGTVGSPHGLKF